MAIPFYTLQFNNPSYVEFMVKQAKQFGLHDIRVIDNASDFPAAIRLLTNLENEGVKIVRQRQNRGHDVFYEMPGRFFMSDPDIIFNKDLPATWINDLLTLQDTTRAQKVGFALRIDDCVEFLPVTNYFSGKSIVQHERRFWINKVESVGLEAYYGEIDTTFCLYNRDFRGHAIRVAGDYSARHDPWYVNPSVKQSCEEVEWYLRTSTCSTIAKALKSLPTSHAPSPVVDTIPSA